MSGALYCTAGKVRCAQFALLNGFRENCGVAECYIDRCTVCVRPESRAEPVMTDAELVAGAAELIRYWTGRSTQLTRTTTSASLWLRDYDAAHPQG